MTPARGWRGMTKGGPTRNLQLVIPARTQKEEWAMTLEEKVLALRLFVMRRAAELENVSEACHQLGISRTLFYRWRARFVRYGADGLKPRPPRRARPTQQASAQTEQAC